MHDLPTIQRSRAERDAAEDAHHFLRRLADRRGIELRPGARVRDLARRLAVVWTAKLADDETAQSVLDWLSDQEDIREVRASEWEIEALL